jgi:hypothetical protein
MILNKEIGYYVVDNMEFVSKIEACAYATLHNREVKWIFNEDTFGNYDWTVEPDETLTELYNQRAREIREKYDYIVISYSAGSDSHNMLMSFIRQGLHVDEIIVNTFEKANKIIVNDISVKDNWNYGAEYKLQIYPRLEEIRKLLPRTKIQVLDLSDHLFNKFQTASDINWVLEQKEVINPSGMTRYNYLHFKEIRKQFDKGYKIALIVGVEKPATYIKGNDFHLVFVDSSANIAPVHLHFKEYENTTIEYFYWHPSCAKLIAKQVHTIKKWLIANPQFKPLWTFTTREQFGKNIATIQQLLRSIIYADTWNTNWYQANKSTRAWYDEIDDWFRASYSDTQEFKVWEAGVSWVKENASRFVRANGEGLEHFAKVYWAGKIN